MKKQLYPVILALLTLVSTSLNARNVFVSGYVVDEFTGMQLPGAKVEIYSVTADTLITKDVALTRVCQNNKVVASYAKFEVRLPYDDKRHNEFRFVVSYQGFDTLSVVIPLQFGRRETEKELEPIKLHRTAHKMKEVTVTASKVKFYYRGDTLVYNADAFLLAEGSMLDALIEQLPGVELKPNGQIFVNGRMVDNILLNGKDFFTSDRKLLLENLGAYTVKELKVYDKLGRTSEFVGRNIGHDSQYVMDVKLKREYSRGSILNLEAAGGTNSRWLGRAFAMYFGDRDRYTFYANGNNLNDSRKPGRSDSWQRGTMQPGEATQAKSGLDYLVEDEKKRWKVQGNVEWNHNNSTLKESTDRQNFLTGGDTYDRIRNISKSRSWAIGTGHDLYLRRKWFDLTLKPSFRYNKGNGSGTLQSSTTLWDNQADTINTSVWLTSRNSHNLNTALDATSTIKFPASPDFLSIKGNFAYGTDWMEQHKSYDINYPKEAGNAEVGHQLYRNHPNYNLAAKLSAQYNYKATRHIDVSLEYGVDYTKNRKRSDMFMLERIADATGNYALQDIYNEIPDLDNSYRSNQSDIGQFVIPRMNMNTSSIWMQACMPVTFMHQTLHYTRGGKQHDIKRNSVVLNVYDTFLQWKNKTNTLKLFVDYKVSTNLPSLTALVDMEDATDPLNIYLGNSELKNAYRNDLDATLMIGSHHSIGIGGSITANALVNGYTYDSQTGVRRFKTYNVSGDWDADASYSGNFYFGKQECMSLYASTDFTYHNAVDMVGEDIQEPQKTNVHNIFLTQTLNYNWKIGKQKIGAKVSGQWRHTTSPDNPGFQPIDAGDLTYGDRVVQTSGQFRNFNGHRCQHSSGICLAGTEHNGCCMECTSGMHFGQRPMVVGIGRL